MEISPERGIRALAPRPASAFTTRPLRERERSRPESRGRRERIGANSYPGAGWVLTAEVLRAPRPRNPLLAPGRRRTAKG